MSTIENDLETLAVHSRGLHHLTAAMIRHHRGGVEYLADETKPQKGRHYTQGELYALRTVAEDARRSAETDTLPAGSPRDGKPGKLAGMLDTILAEITAAQGNLSASGMHPERYPQAKLSNAIKLAALARGVLLEELRSCLDVKHGVVNAADRAREFAAALDSALRIATERAETLEATPSENGTAAAPTAPILEPLPVAGAVIVEGSLSLQVLRTANAVRQKEWCSNGQVPDLAYRGLELAGEVGEALNVLKKLERERLGWAGSRTTLDALRAELADVVISADLVALCLDLDLAGAIVDKFNVTSHERGLSTILQRRPAPAVPPFIRIESLARLRHHAGPIDAADLELLRDSLAGVCAIVNTAAESPELAETETRQELSRARHTVRLALELLNRRTVPSPWRTVGLASIAHERRRQIDVEGWTEEHDRLHHPLDLLNAGRAYIAHAGKQLAKITNPLAMDRPACWPWSGEWWKPADNAERNVEKGAALVVAALDRMHSRHPLPPTSGRHETGAPPSDLPETGAPALRPPMILDRSDSELPAGRPICGHTATPGALADFVPATVNGCPAVVDLVRAMAVLIHPGEVLEHGKQAKGALPAKLQRDGSRVWAWFILHESHSVVIL